jgi:hypothetical protein
MISQPKKKTIVKLNSNKIVYEFIYSLKFILFYFIIYS